MYMLKKSRVKYSSLFYYQFITYNKEYYGHRNPIFKVIKILSLPLMPYLKKQDCSYYSMLILPAKGMSEKCLAINKHSSLDFDSLNVNDKENYLNHMRTLMN
jgi:hypothetical protein